MKQLSIKVLRHLILGKKYIGCNLSLRQFSWRADFLGAICSRGNYVDGKSSERQFSLSAISRGYYQRAIILEVIVQEQ